MNQQLELNVSPEALAVLAAQVLTAPHEPRREAPKRRRLQQPVVIRHQWNVSCLSG